MTTDPTPQTIFDRIDWPQTVLVLGLAAVVALVVMYGPEEVRVPLATAVVALVGIMRGVLRGPTASLLVLMTAATLTLPGCGASALRAHATTATVLSTALVGSQSAITAACATQRRECEDGSNERWSSADACLADLKSNCEEAADAQDVTRDAVAAYIDAIEVAHLADEGQGVAALAASLEMLEATWLTFASGLGALGIDVPELTTITASAGVPEGE